MKGTPTWLFNENSFCALSTQNSYLKSVSHRHWRQFNPNWRHNKFWKKGKGVPHQKF
jgi:hypothetical protein